MYQAVLKLLTFLFLFPGLVYALPAQKYLHVNGKILNFRHDPDTVKYITASVLDRATNSPVQTLIAIRGDGSFSAAVPLQLDQNIDFDFLKTRFGAFAHPGGTLSIKFDSNNPVESLMFAGDEARLNNEMHRYLVESRKFRQRRWPALKQQMEETKDSPDLYKKLAFQNASLDQNFLDSFSKANSVSALFRSHAQIDLNYSTAYDLMTFGLNNSHTTENYYSFLNEFSPQNPAAFFSDVYMMFLESYVQYLRKDSNDIDLYISSLPRKTNGFVHDMLFSWEMSEFLDADLLEGAEQYFPAYRKTVQNTALKDRITDLYQQKKRSLAQQTLSKDAHFNKLAGSDGQQLLQQIIDKYKGSVVYVDFWGTWCVPCLEEMPASKKLRNEMQGSKVVFLYLAVQSQADSWKRTIAKLDIKGEHYLLKDQEYQLLNALFNMQGVPHYVLIDKEGNIREKNASSPGSPGLREKMDNLLK